MSTWSEAGLIEAKPSLINTKLTAHLDFPLFRSLGLSDHPVSRYKFQHVELSKRDIESVATVVASSYHA
jgi:hypothetical protein